MPILTKKNLMNPKAIEEAEKVRGAISAIVRTSGSVKDSTISYLSYVLFKIKQNDSFSNYTFSSILENKDKWNEGVILSLREHTELEKSWELLTGLLTGCSSEIFALASCITSDSRIEVESSTPDSIIKLAKRILNIKRGDSVLDLCSGVGKFLIDCELDEPDAFYTGVELNKNSLIQAELRKEMFGSKVSFIERDVLQSYNQDSNTFLLPDERKYNKIFSNYSFGLRLFDFPKGFDLKTRNTDWFFNSLICSKLDDNGKAVAIMTNGSTWNSSDLDVRKQFIEEGKISAIISLPKNMFPYTMIPTTFIVFTSKENNSIRFIDASNIFQEGRRVNEFNDDDINKIINALSEDSEISKEVSLSDIKNQNYKLNPGTYTSKLTKFENGVHFGDVIKSVTRGAPLKAVELDKIASSEKTNMQYLQLANIKNGLIEDNLPYITEIDPKYDKYCLKNNNLILSKNGAPFKIAVAELESVTNRILANGNLFVIELDEEKVNPFFLTAFFNSNTGSECLKRISVGTAIPNIGVEDLKNMIIPLPSLEEQNTIAHKYQAARDEIKVLKLKLSDVLERMQSVFDNEGGR